MAYKPNPSRAVRSTHQMVAITKKQAQRIAQGRNERSPDEAPALVGSDDDRKRLDALRRAEDLRIQREIERDFRYRFADL